MQMLKEAHQCVQHMRKAHGWNSWQSGRGDAYCVLDPVDLELGGCRTLALACALLSAVCGQLAKLHEGGVDIHPTLQVQLACYDQDSHGYDRHVDSSPLDELEHVPDVPMRAVIASRITAILYLNPSAWQDDYGGQLRAHTADDACSDPGSLRSTDIVP